MARLGFVGLGAMGGRIARRLLNAGHSVTGHNRTKSKAQWLLDAGMQWRDTPREVAEAVDVVFTMVTNTDALQQVFSGPDGILAGLKAGKVYVDMSTISPTASRELATQVAAKGAHMLDVPVSGSVITLEQGNLSLMAGGDHAIFEQIKPILLDIGPKVNYVGPNGQAVLMKVAINLNLAVQLLAFSEGLLLAEKGGIPRETAHEVMLNSVIASPSLKYRTPFILKEAEEVWFDVNMMQKDLLLALEMGRALDVPMPTTAVSNEFLTATRAMGLAKHDFAVLFKALARMAGLEE
ncbi:MAG TPA: NAD(P)-dependent oxidoreductase [Ktedonobacteraceae bacterium]|nr:NAD(P)-dependent oxidoreductase [Ktedonobacteraceae bacterium]